MTTSALVATPRYTPRPVAWRGLGWVAWRRYRVALAATGALLVVATVFLLITGTQMRHAYAAVQACTPASGPACNFAWNDFRDSYGNQGLLGALAVWIPGLIGAFAGAPLLAGELETGTVRFVWTQGVGRTRWLLSLLVPGALGVAAVSAGVGVLIAWYHEPLVASGIQQRLVGSVFPVTGVAVVGWGLAGFALGVLTGALLRRVVPALATTLVVWTGLAVLTATLRNHYLAPRITSSQQLASGDFSVEQWWTHHGVRVGDAQINQALQAIGVQSDGGGAVFKAGPGSDTVDPVQYLVQHGYTQWTSYQPDSRFWPFQGIEFGWLAALSVLLLATAVWLMRRRDV